ncbi:MAG TPA: DUF883 family protein [Steroidobacteraceae bacterium]|nr:DUF883 family protein [Steroidobacteraceae bacterium]
MKADQAHTAGDQASAADIAGKELRDVLASVEALLQALENEGGAAVEELRERLTRTVADVKKQLGGTFLSNARETLSKVRDTATSVDEFVQRRPWAAVGMAAVGGVLVGLMLKGD